jgi:hypothetical protein
MTSLTERYKSLSNWALLDIIENVEDYTPVAIQTAEAEIESRNLTDEAMAEAKSMLKVKAEDLMAKNEKKQFRQNKFKRLANDTIDDLNPIQNEPFSLEKQIRYISIAFGLVSVYLFKLKFGFMRYLFMESEAIGFDSLLFILPVILLPIASILFGLRKKAGWIMLCIYIVYSGTNAVIFSVINFNTEATGIPAIDILFPPIPINVSLVVVLFYIGSLWAINRMRILAIFGISSETRVGVIAFTGVVAGLTMMSYLF